MVLSGKFWFAILGRCYQEEVRSEFPVASLIIWLAARVQASLFLG